MNLSYETKDWLFDNALWIFIGMVAFVMLIGPWQLRRQVRKNSAVQITAKQNFLISFFSGGFSIILFYGLALVIIPILLLIGSFLDLFTHFKNHEFPESLILSIYVIVYYIILYCGIRVIIISFSTRNELQTNLPPVPFFNNAESHAESALPPKSKYNRFIKYPIRWTTGWHLTVICGLCTIIFYVCFTGQMRDKSMGAVYGSSVSQIAHVLPLYVNTYNEYPDDLKRLIENGYASPSTIERAVNQEYWEYQEADKFKTPSYIHFLPLPENAPKDLLFVWADPEKYHSATMPIAFFDGAIKFIKKKELPALIERSQKWLAEHPQPDKTPSTQKSK